MKDKKNIKNILMTGTIIGILGIIFLNNCFAVSKAKVNVNVANIRKEPNATSTIVEQAAKGEEIQIVESVGEWYKVKYNKIEGYVKKELFDIEGEAPANTNTEATATETPVSEASATTNTVETPVSTPAPENANTENAVDTEKTEVAQPAQVETVVNTENATETAKMYTCKENVKLKILPLISGNVIKEIAKDATVNVLEINNNWALVESGTNRGWLLVSKLALVDTSKPVENTAEQQAETTKTETPVDAQQPETVADTQQAETPADVQQPETAADTQQAETPADAQQSETVTPEQTVTEVAMYVNSELVNLRKEESTSSESLEKLTKGTQVTKISENNGWSKVKVNDIEGYIASSLLSDRKPETTTSRSLEEARQDLIQKEEAKKSATAQTNNTETAVPAEESKPLTEEQQQEKNSQQVANSSKGQEVCAYAKQFLGCKYVYGGTSPTKGFDCSGFTQYVYKHFGVSLSRTAESQANNGTYVKKSDLRAGDLVIFTHHVGIYLGNGRFIHAANSRKGVITTSMSDSYYVKNYITARRIFN